MATRWHSRSRSLFPGPSVARLLVMHVIFFPLRFISACSIYPSSLCLIGDQCEHHAGEFLSGYGATFPVCIYRPSDRHLTDVKLMSW